MNSAQSQISRAAPWLTLGSAISIILSIAISQIFLGLAIAALLLSGDRVRLPRIRLALGLFLLGTIVSLLFSGEIAAGLPQIRKFFVFGELLIVFSCLRDLGQARWIFLSWAALGCVEAIRGFIQFGLKVQQAHRLGINFYNYYVGQRITGFTSHWNTYSAEEMFALLMLTAFLFFAPQAQKRLWVWILFASIIGVAIVLGETRGVWLATLAGVLYLVWFWRPKLLIGLPVLLVIAFFVAPPAIRQRFESIAHPKEEDSNRFRVVTWRTGVQMIERHPWLGLGPEGPKYHFKEYIPADIPRPLPVGFYEHLHNIYLQYAAERGIPTALLFLWMLVQILVDCSHGIRRLPPGPGTRRFLLHGAVAVVIAAMVEGFVEVNLGDSEVLSMFLIAVACGYLALEKDVAIDEPLSAHRA